MLWKFYKMNRTLFCKHYFAKILYNIANSFDFIDPVSLQKVFPNILCNMRSYPLKQSQTVVLYMEYPLKQACMVR